MLTDSTMMSANLNPVLDEHLFTNGGDLITLDGEDYGPGQTFIVPGSEVAGFDTTNDLTITITTVDATGLITGVSSSGTANNGVACCT